MHITITGNLGSGKSTICKIMEDKYGFEIYSTGKVQRELAREMNMTTLEMNQLMCSDPKYDTMIDDATARISRENRDKKIIFDSRLAWNFVEQSFKVFLSVSLSVAANRVLNDNRGKEEQYKDIDEARKLLAARAETENKRYKDMYNLNYFDFNNYNLVIDSTCCTSEKIASVIMEEAKRYYEELNNSKELNNSNELLADNKKDHIVLLSPRRLYTGDISADEKELIKTLEINTKNVNYIGSNIKVKQDADDYVIVEGMNEVITAIEGQVPFVAVKII
jgi:cytidylate kinase